MTRAEVRQFIESGIEELSQLVRFDSGRISEFNSQRSNEYPFAWLESPSNNPDFFNSMNGLQVPYDHWEIAIHIANKDSQDSSPAQYEAIIDDCDAIAQQLQHKYNTIVSGFNLSLIEGISRVPFVKKHADILTGVIFSFTLTAPDTTNLCT